jgi:hypothetical protein
MSEPDVVVMEADQLMEEEVERPTEDHEAPTDGSDPGQTKAENVAGAEKGVNDGQIDIEKPAEV